jgi:hypothetical protein
MVATWVLWLFLVGLAIGIVVTLVIVVRLPRREGDVGDQERPLEAAWISGIIERHGGVAPVLLVEEVLDLHQAYLREARPPVPPRTMLGEPPTPPLPGFDPWAAPDPWTSPPSYPAAPPPPPPAAYPAAPPGPPPASTPATPPRPR